MAMNVASVKILGSRVHLVQMHEVLALMETWIEARAPPCRQVVVTGFHGLWEAHKDPGFRAILNSADLWVPDGIAPVWIGRCRGWREARRLPGADLMQAFFALANRQGYRSFFYGDTEEVLGALRQRLARDYPGHKTVGTFSPPFRTRTAAEDAAHVRMINEARPDVLWVGLGLPKQDRWIHAHLPQLKAPIAVGVGAAFGFLSGKVKRAPPWLGTIGLEWVYRLIKEPRKCWRRSLVDGPQFVAHVLLELAGLRKYE